MSDITDIKGEAELLEPVRLAPSAVNLQNWYFTGDKNAIHAYSSKPNFLRNIVGGATFLSIWVLLYAIYNLQRSIWAEKLNLSLTVQGIKTHPRTGRTLQL